ncbi:MAG: NusG domain II-containing protein [Huintestinicola sp.]
MENRSRRKRIIEISVIILMLICSAAAGCFFFTASPSGYAVIYKDGTEICRRSLSDNGVFSADGISGMKFEISEGAVRVLESDCPDKICVKSGWLRLESQSAVCMPNKVILMTEAE